MSVRCFSISLIRMCPWFWDVVGRAGIVISGAFGRPLKGGSVYFR